MSHPLIPLEYKKKSELSLMSLISQSNLNKILSWKLKKSYFLWRGLWVTKSFLAFIKFHWPQKVQKHNPRNWLAPVKMKQLLVFYLVLISEIFCFTQSSNELTKSHHNKIPRILDKRFRKDHRSQVYKWSCLLVFISYPRYKCHVLWLRRDLYDGRTLLESLSLTDWRLLFKGLPRPSSPHNNSLYNFHLDSEHLGLSRHWFDSNSIW